MKIQNTAPLTQISKFVLFFVCGMLPVFISLVFRLCIVCGATIYRPTIRILPRTDFSSRGSKTGQVSRTQQNTPVSAFVSFIYLFAACTMINCTTRSTFISPNDFPAADPGTGSRSPHPRCVRKYNLPPPNLYLFTRQNVSTFRFNHLNSTAQLGIDSTCC